MDRKIVFVILGLLLLVGGVVFFLNMNNNQLGNEPITTSVTTEEKSTEVSIENNKQALVADLKDVSGGDSGGTGYVLREDLLSHKVVANLPDLEGTNFYEGWLVQQEPTLKFFSTGEMTKQTDGTFLLEYSSDELSDDYNFVVITLETKRDSTPEAHIIEGLAE